MKSRESQIQIRILKLIFVCSGKPHIPNIDCEDEDFSGIADESFNDVQKHMEMIQREMESIFRSFGGMHMPCKCQTIICLD